MAGSSFMLANLYDFPKQKGKKVNENSEKEWCEKCDNVSNSKVGMIRENVVPTKPKENCFKLSAQIFRI